TSSAPINTAPQASNTGSAAASESDALAGLPTSASFGNSIYPGGATFVTPTGSASVSPLYRIDPQENVTFIWEFENLSVQPANLTLAAVGPNSVTYTISAMGGLETSAVWHVSDVPLDYPLMNGYYQIQLYDQRGISAIQSPGWLSPQTTLSIAFYTSGNYENSTATVGNECPTCFYDGAVGLGSAFGIACITSALFIYNLLY
ncbi:hypothetical protein BDB00DRAFT_754997, partial [Zychaea mexicana]|uniref:uncharacterized protein n=1 Tax=Zychaea mexicana TaxID=64656 RepID=UPI0022FE4B58